MRRNLVGEKFGRLLVIAPAEDVRRSNGKPRPRWLCRCECGREKIIYGECLTGGRTLSCGCLQKERTSEAATTHGDTDSRLYGVWCSIKQRCYNSATPVYPRYGGRGITMCDEWREHYSAFKEWAIINGYDADAPRGECTIDRIDVNGNYEPQNCRWVDQKTQMNNVSYNHIEEYNGESHTLAEWADMYNVPYSRVIKRIEKYGYNLIDALTKPPRHFNK